MVIFFNIIYTFLGSIFESCYIQNRVITNRVIEVVVCHGPCEHMTLGICISYDAKVTNS